MGNVCPVKDFQESGIAETCKMAYAGKLCADWRKCSGCARQRRCADFQFPENCVYRKIFLWSLQPAGQAG